MRHTVKVLIAVLFSLIVLPARAEPAWSEASLDRAAAACTAEGAYGYKFGDRQRRFGFVFSKAQPEDAPVVEIAINTSMKTFQVFVIDGTAIFASSDAPPTDADKADATAFFEALDAKIRATRPFARREATVSIGGDPSVQYWSSTDKNTGYSLTVGRNGVRVAVSCKDEGMMPLVWHEAMD